MKTPLISLFTLVPMAVGTADIECFDSYLHRLAAAHSCTFWQFCRVISPLCEERGVQRLDSRAFNLSGSTSTIRVLTVLLSECTNVGNLDRTTFISLSECVARYQARSFKHSRHWCPACLREAIDCGSPFYDRLLWRAGVVQRCPTHRLRLADSCDVCHYKQRFLNSSGDLSKCCKCNSSLCSRQEKWIFDPMPSFGESDMLELVGAISDGSFSRAEPGAFLTFVEELNRLLPARSSIRSSINTLGKFRAPTLFTMLSASNLAGVTLLDVFIDPKQAARNAGGLGFDTHKQASSPRPRHSDSVLKNLCEKVRNYLKEPHDVPVPPLRAVTRALGVTPGLLLHRNSDLYKSYMARRKLQLKIRRLRLDARVSSILSGGLFDLYLNGGLHSQDALVEEICKQCGVSKHVARTHVSRYYKQHRRGA